MAQLSYVLTRLSIPPRGIKCVKTDAFILDLPVRKRTSAKAIEELRFNQLHTLRRDRELCSEPSQQFLNCRVEMTPLTSSDPVFRFSDVGTPLQGRYQKPRREVPPPTLLPHWRDLTVDEARTCLAEGHSLLVVGAPGSGKSHWVREHVRELRKSGKRVDVVAKTHAAVQNFGEGAQTADHWVRQRVRNGGAVSCDVLVIEEITQLEVQLWADICKLALAEIAFVLCGDFLQFPAVCQHWAGYPVADGALEASHMVLDLAGGNRLTLVENMRSDQELFDFYTSLAARPLQSLLLEARTRFPRTHVKPRQPLSSATQNVAS